MYITVLWGVLSTGLLVNSDITNGTIDLTTKVTNVLPIANGGTNSSAALSGSSIIISDGTSIIQGDKGTSTTLLHGNASGSPTYSQVVNADIANGTIDLTSKVTGTLPVFNGGTGVTTFGGANQVLFTTAADALTSVATSTAAGQFLQTSTAGGVPTWKTILDVVNGGTSSGTALSGKSIMVSNGSAIVQAPLMTDGQIIVGKSGDAPQQVLLGGDATINNAGSLLISNNAVTYAKMQNVSTTSKLLGSSSLTNAVTEITLGSGLSMTNSTLTATGLGGTVTNFAAGNLPPVFTTSVADPTGSPVLSFSLTNANPYTIFGNNTNASAAPAYFAPVLASALFANQGSINTVLHGNATGDPSWGQIVNADITDGTINLTTKVTGALPIINGGTNSNTPLVNNRLMISKSGKIVELGAPFLDGQVLVGKAGDDPQVVSLSGDVSITNTGSTTVGSVGGSTAANINTAELLANAATNLNTSSTIVLRDGSGNFSAGTISADLTGDVTGDLTGNVTGNVLGNLTGDVTGNVSGTSLNVTGIVAILNGGTGSSTVLGAKTNLGLENVDNTTDLNKPISTATQTALNLKAPLASPALTGFRQHRQQ
ncbi:MAG: hypothetical protein IPJ16_00740 [Bacteroidales bacterium]|nr:hypothetical protein [Bacteroidales bacterium]